MTTETTTAIETITIDNVVYNVPDLTEQQQQLINIFKQWKDSEQVLKAELDSLKNTYLDSARRTQMELMKTQAALRQLGNEISLSVKSVLAVERSGSTEETLPQ